MAKPYPKKGVVKKSKEPLLPVFKLQWDKREDIDSIPAIEDFATWMKLVFTKRMCGVTYLPLTQFDVWQHAHILTRNYTKIREDYFNVVLMTREAHSYFDTRSREDFLTLGPGAKYVLQYREQLKQIYHTIPAEV